MEFIETTNNSMSLNDGIETLEYHYDYVYGTDSR